MTTNYLDDGLKGWLFETARKNLWKVGSWYDLDDLVQEGYLTYCKCLKGFKFDPLMEGALEGRDLVKEEQKTFMKYFKWAYENRLRDLAKNKTNTLDNSFADLTLESESEKEFDFPQPEEASAYTTIAQAPKEILDAIQILIQDVQDAGKYLRTKLSTELGFFHKTGTFVMAPRVYLGKEKIRETNREYYRRLLGRDVTFLRDYLKEG